MKEEYGMQIFIINENDSGQRIDKFIQKAIPSLPKSAMYRLIRKKDIKLNGRRCGISDRLCTGDKVTVYVPDTAVKATSFTAAPPDIDIVYEDENILIVNKPAGLTVHSDNERCSDNLIDRIKHYLFINGAYRPDEENTFAPALCSRLDRNTCGLVTAAKNAAALREINSAIAENRSVKLYHCITCGIPEVNTGILTAYHCKESKENIVRISKSPKDGYKEIKTGFRLLESRPPLSLLEIHLYTGRTHQIRAHLASIGLPVLGDTKYGCANMNKQYHRFTQALCAYSLCFSFPESSPLSYLSDRIFTAPVPEFEREFYACINKK